MASGKPLTKFLLALCHTPELAERFSDPDQRPAVLEQFGLSEHELFVNGEPTLESVQAAVAAETRRCVGRCRLVDLVLRRPGSMTKRPEWIWGVDDKPDDDDDAAGATDSDDDEDADDDGGTST